MGALEHTCCRILLRCHMFVHWRRACDTHTHTHTHIHTYIRVCVCVCVFFPPLFLLRSCLAVPNVCVCGTTVSAAATGQPLQLSQQCFHFELPTGSVQRGIGFDVNNRVGLGWNVLVDDSCTDGLSEVS